MIGKIKRHELRDIWRNEALDFTKWMEANIESLTEALGFDLTVESREHSVGPFSVDLLATDEFGQKVVIENQLEKTDHSHLGQIITYCTNLDAKTCIWITKEPRQEHINAVNWLNKETSLSFYMLSIEAISIDESRAAPLFQIICRPDEEIRLAAATDAELTDRGRFNIDFWSEMNKKCESVLPGFCGRKPLKYHFHSQAAGRGGFNYSFIAGSKFYAVDFYIDTTDEHLNKFILSQLVPSQEQIEKSFGKQLHFDPIPGKRACKVRYVIGNGDVMKLNKEKVQKELINHMISLEKTFKPIIPTLPYDVEDAA